MKPAGKASTSAVDQAAERAAELAGEGVRCVSVLPWLVTFITDSGTYLHVWRGGAVDVGHLVALPVSLPAPTRQVTA